MPSVNPFAKQHTREQVPSQLPKPIRPTQHVRSRSRMRIHRNQLHRPQRSSFGSHVRQFLQQRDAHRIRQHDRPSPIGFSNLRPVSHPQNILRSSGCLRHRRDGLLGRGSRQIPIFRNPAVLAALHLRQRRLLSHSSFGSTELSGIQRKIVDERTIGSGRVLRLRFPLRRDRRIEEVQSVPSNVVQPTDGIGPNHRRREETNVRIRRSNPHHFVQLRR
mmetsp:Transcript_9309/g.18870  ORF Transcript_9309/g.18870 Transcript_9309/m.18870 type:complete len:218 (+) Transcript_9309:1161-1814(+)